MPGSQAEPEHVEPEQAEPDWTTEEDDLLLALLYTNRSGIQFAKRRPWRDVSMDMNAEAVRFGLKTRFFHDEKVRSRWCSRYGLFHAVGTTEEDEAEPPKAPRATSSLAPLRDVLARIGVGSLNGQPLPPPVQRGFELPRPVLPARDSSLQAQTANGNADGEAGGDGVPDGGTSGSGRAYTDGKGKRLARDPTKSWLF